MPSKLASWKEKDVMKGRIERMQTADLFQITATSIQDDVSSRSRLITISRQNDGYLIRSVCRQIIASVVCVVIEAKGDPALLVWSHVLGELKGLFVKLDSWMTLVSMS